MNERIEDVKKHIKKNKKVYIAAGIGVVVGGAGVFLATQGGPKNVVQQLNFWSPSNITQIIIPNNGNSGNVLQDLENGVIYPSQNAAVRALNLDKANLSRHLNGKNEHVNGHVFKKLIDGGTDHELASV